MKKFLYIVFYSTFMVVPGLAQITVDQSDMPLAGDTLRVSLTNIVPPGYAGTGFDTTWNFTALEALSQRVDTFVAATATPPVYQLVFVLAGGANLAIPRSNAPLPGLPITDGYSFFRNEPLSFSELGAAYSIQGLPLLAKYDVPDKLFQFPMIPGLSWSSTSTFSISVPGLAYYRSQRFRTNFVDGWGLLSTPYGSFQTLRVKSLVTMQDSIYIDSLGTGFPFNRDITEYKWLAKGKGIPVLQINEEGSLLTAVYRDIYRMPANPLTVSLGQDTAVVKGSVITLQATVTGGTPPYQIFWNTLDTGYAITVTVDEEQTFSVIVADALQNFGLAQKVVSIIYPPGFQEENPMWIRIFPNPSAGRFRISGFSDSESKVQVFSPLGELVLTTSINPGFPEPEMDLTGFHDGLYLLRITTGNHTIHKKLQVRH